MLSLAQLLALSVAQPQPQAQAQPHFHRCGPDHDAECSAFSLLSVGSCADTPGCAPILDEAECRALHSQVDLAFREGSGHFVVGSAQRDSVAAGCLFFAGGGHREGGRHKFNANAASSAACGERTQCICSGDCAPLAANAAPHAVVDHTGSSEPGGHAGSHGRVGPSPSPNPTPTPALPPVVGERQLQRAWLQLVVGTPPRTPAATLAGHKAQHGSFERSLQKDIRDALSVRPEGRIDVRNISFESLSPYRGERGERDNVSAAKVSVVWCCDTVDAEDVRTAIMVRFMPNGTRAPSECGIDMTTPGAVTILQEGVLCTTRGHVYEADRERCCPATRRRRPCAAPCGAGSSEHWTARSDEVGCLLGRSCACGPAPPPHSRGRRAAADRGTADGAVAALALSAACACLWRRCVRKRAAKGDSEASDGEGDWLLDGPVSSGSDCEAERKPRPQPLATAHASTT